MTLSADECGFNVAYFPVVDIMATLTGESVVTAEFMH